MVEQLRIAELVQAAQALRDTLRDKEKEMEGTAREARKQQADQLRSLGETQVALMTPLLTVLINIVNRFPPPSC